MRVLICGSRFWKAHGPIRRELIYLLQMKFVSPLVIIHGAAPGADSIAAIEADWLNLEIISFPAHWSRYPRGAAGPIRNRQMLEEGHPDLVLAFHKEISESKGTADMVQRAKAAGVPVRVFST